MGESHHRPGHFIGTDLCPEPKPPLLRYIFSWKHLRDPADFGRLEEFNEAVRRLESGGHRMESVVGQVAPVVVIAAQSSGIVDGADVSGGGGGPGKKPRFRSLNFIYGKGRDAEDGPEQGRALPDEKTDSRAEGDDDMAASACERISNDDIRSPAIFGDGDQAVGEHHQQGSVPGSGEVCHDDHEITPSSSAQSFVDLTSSTSTEAVEVSEHSPDCAQDAGTEGDQLMASPVEAHLQVPAPTSCGDVVGAEVQDSGPSSTNLPSRAASPSAAADKTGGGGCVDLHGHGERIAMEMDKDAIRSENVGQVASVVVTTAQAEIDADVGASGGQKKKAKFRRMTFVCGKGRKSRDVENGREHAPPEKTDEQCTDGDVRASASCAGMQSPFISTPADGVLGDDTQTDPATGEHHQGSSLGCGNADQESRPSSSRKSLVDLNLSPRTDADEALDHSPACAHDATTEGDLATPLAAYLQVPAPASGDVVGAEVQDFGPSSPNLSDDTVPSRAPSPSASADNTGGGGSIDLHRLGERIAMEMDEDAIRLEVARQFGAHRPRRGARRRAAAPVVPRVQFSLRLSHEEAMEDVAAVSIPEDVEPEAPAPAPAGHGSRKRRRRGG